MAAVSERPRHALSDTDGRNVRRDRNREAVVRALLDLYYEYNFEPSAEEIASRSGVSARSIFRYFDDVDDLRRAAITLHLYESAHLIPIDCTPDSNLDDKIQAVVSQRSELFETCAPIAIITRLRAPFQPVIDELLTDVREMLRLQITTVFAPELAAMPAALVPVRIAAGDIATSFETWLLLRHTNGFDRAAAESTVGDALHLIFSTN